MAAENTEPTERELEDLSSSLLYLSLNMFLPQVTAAENSEPTKQELEDLWDEVSSELSAIFQGWSEIPTDVTPFDAASEVDVDEQR